MKRSNISVFIGFVALVSANIMVRNVTADAPPGRYVILGDGTVYDTKTLLTWQQDVPATMYNWAEGNTACMNPGLPGTGWRLPSSKEIQTLADEGAMTVPYVDANAFPNTPLGWYWTSTQLWNNPDTAWAAVFGDGAIGVRFTDTTGFVRCVR